MVSLLSNSVEESKDFIEGFYLKRKNTTSHELSYRREHVMSYKRDDKNLLYCLKFLYAEACQE